MANTVSEQEASRRRRVINTALKDVLPEKEILQAINVWEKNFYNSSTFRIPSFISKAQERLGFSSEIKKTLLRSLNRSLASPLELLEPDPLQKQETVEEKLTGEYVVFELLLSSLLTNLGNQDIKILQNSLLASFPSTSFSNTAKQNLTKWSNSITTNSVKRIASGLKPTEMSKTLDVLYESFCELLGPVKTDRIFAQAIREAEHLPEARDFPPKQLF